MRTEGEAEGARKERSEGVVMGEGRCFMASARSSRIRMLRSTHHFTEPARAMTASAREGSLGVTVEAMLLSIIRRLSVTQTILPGRSRVVGWVV